jgi:hypothetical protein
LHKNRIDSFMIFPGLLLLSLALTPAQVSTSYKIEEHTFNAGGRPEGGAIASSAGFRISLDAIGDGVVGRGLASASYVMDGGLVSAYPPPGEVVGLRFESPQFFSWDAEGSVGTYGVYRDSFGTLPGGYGVCFDSGITGTSTQDLSSPSPGQGWYYLVTARNRLAEEGSKGTSHDGTQRGNPSPCP